jgi:hypothetical protein
MSSVQLIGRKPIISRYEKLDCEAWALYQGKQFMVGGVGSDSLSDWLTDLEQSQSTATYTLRVYDSNEAPTSSTGGSDYVASVNFKVLDTYEGYGIAGRGDRVMDRIKGLEDEIKKLNKPPADDDEDGGTSIGAIVSDWLENPEKLAVIVGIAKQLFTGGAGSMPIVAAAQPIQSISGFNNMDTTAIRADSPEGLQRIAAALDILGKHDANLVLNLETLARLAETKPAIFENMLRMLSTIQ